MKRKVVMMGLAMIAGVPHAGHAKGVAKDNPAQSYSSWNTPYAPHFGEEGKLHPLLDHFSVPGVLPRRDRDAWRLEFAPPKAVSAADDPLSAKDKRMGITLKLDF